jgi:hypothetical protein
MFWISTPLQMGARVRRLRSRDEVRPFKMALGIETLPVLIPCRAESSVKKNVIPVSY